MGAKKLPLPRISMLFSLNSPTSYTNSLHRQEDVGSDDENGRKNDQDSPADSSNDTP